MNFKMLFSALIAPALLAAPALAADVMNTPEEKAMAAADEIITMRSTLPAEFIKPGAGMEEGTSKKAWGAVANGAKYITEKAGVKIRHAAVKNRNPLNAADAREQ